MADTIKCPNCAANLMFEADSQKLECDFCGKSFSIEEIESILGEFKKEADPEQVELEKTEETVSHEHLEAIEGAEDSPADNMEFTCNSCGGKILSDMNTSATFCPFCGSPALVGQRLTGEFEPKYIIPFKYNRKQAVEAFMKWCKGGRYTPVGFVSDKNISKITGLYVPFWLVNIKATVDIEGKAEKVKKSGDYTYIDKYNIRRYGDLNWEKIPFDGETRIDDKLMESIEPYDYKELVPYDFRYLPGYFADRFDQNEEDLRKRILERGKEYLDKELKDTLKGMSSISYTKNAKGISKTSAEYALLPVWFMSYKYLGKNYYFAMNGQTGEVAGKLPVSKVKRLMFFSVTLAIVSLIVRFIMGLIMGGMVG